jgi:hypothetical protein
MRTTIRAAALCGALSAVLVISGCPAQPTYPSTITPIYAATAGNGLFVYNGSSWTNYTVANSAPNFVSDTLSSVVVIGSGTNAQVFVGSSNSGISAFNGSSWFKWTNSSGLGSNTINRLLVGSTIYAATGSGLAAYNTDGSSTPWTNDTGSTYAFAAVNDVFVSGSYTYIAAAASGLIIDNGAGSEARVTAATLAAAGLTGTTSVTAVFVDGYGNLIVGTNTGLAVRYAGASTWTVLQAGPHVSQLRMDSFGNLFASAITAGGGVYIFSTNPTTGVFGLPGTLVLAGTPVNSVAVDGTDTLYAATGGGLLISKDGGSSWTPDATLAGKSVMAVTTTAPLYQF